MSSNSLSLLASMRNRRTGPDAVQLYHFLP
jgi:hypothetical protein